MDRVDWDAYVAAYHHARPGITETALLHARHPVLGTAYEWLVAAVPDPAGDVLDLACGSCAMQPHVRGSSYLGIDCSEDELATARAAGRGPVRAGDVTDLDVPDTSVDTVVMSMALMLVPLHRTLAQVVRVLRPGGTFVAVVPAFGPIRAADLPGIATVSLALRGPGSMPSSLGARAATVALRQAGLTAITSARARFPFPVRTPDDARLAVSSLYTPGRSPAALRRAERWLLRTPGASELPVPLLRITGRKSAVRSGPE